MMVDLRRKQQLDLAFLMLPGGHLEGPAKAGTFARWKHTLISALHELLFGSPDPRPGFVPN